DPGCPGSASLGHRRPDPRLDPPNPGAPGLSFVWPLGVGAGSARPSLPILVRLALELVVPARLAHGTMVLALWVLVPLALAVLELAPLNSAVGIMCLFQPCSPKLCPSGYVMNWDWITGR